MKKIYLFLLPLLALMSCGNSYIYNGFSVETYDVHIDASDWQYTDYTANNLPYANNYFYCSVDMPEITSSVFNEGEVQAYIVYDKRTQTAFKHLLPYVRHYEEDARYKHLQKVATVVHIVEEEYLREASFRSLCHSLSNR